MILKILKWTLNILLIIVGVPFLCWIGGFLLFAENVMSMAPPSLTSPPVNAAIVLTGGSNRIKAGLDLLSTHKIKNLLISGVGKGVTRKDIIRQAAYNGKLPDCCITLGHDAENTIGNASESQKWLHKNNYTTALVVTSNYHMQRALVEFHHAVPEVNFIPYPVEPEKLMSDDQLFWRLSFLEYHKYLMTVFRVNMYPQETSPMPQVLIQ